MLFYHRIPKSALPSIWQWWSIFCKTRTSRLVERKAFFAWFTPLAGPSIMLITFLKVFHFHTDPHFPSSHRFHGVPAFADGGLELNWDFGSTAWSRFGMFVGGVVVLLGAKWGHDWWAKKEACSMRAPARCECRCSREWGGLLGCRQWVWHMGVYFIVECFTLLCLH